MKKIASILVSTMLLSAALVGCGSGEEAPAATDTTTDTSVSTTDTTTADSTTQNAGDAPVEPQSGSIEMGGSTSVEEIVTAMIQVYNEMHPDLTINYSGNGSSTGVSGALNGDLGIGLASRELKEAEITEGAEAIPFAYDGIAVIVNTANTVTNLTSEQLAQVFKGEITDWSELGGEAGEIVVVSREAGSGTRGAFEEIVDIVDLAVSAGEQSSTGGVISTVQTNAAAIGYVSLSSLNENIAAVSIDDVVPSEETVKSKEYAIQRPFNFVVKAGTDDTLVNNFIAWATSAEVAELVASKGAVAPS